MNEAEIWSSTTGLENAPRVLLIHGSLDRSAGLLKLGRRLAQQCRVTRYDRRGYGRSASCDGPFDMDRQVSDGLDVMDRAGEPGDDWTLVGHSYGGNVALAIANRAPDRVRALVTYESPMSWEPWWPGTTAGGNAVLWEDDPEEAAERFMRRLIGDRRWDRLPPATRRSRRAEGPAMIGELTDLREHRPWDPTLVRAAVIAMYGEHGLAHHRAAMESIGETVASAAVVEVAGGRHFGPNTHPDAVADHVLRLIAAVTG